jgi:predicted RNA methylase
MGNDPLADRTDGRKNFRMPTLVSELTPEYRFAAAPAIPRYCTSLLNRACDFVWERKLGIHTTGGAPSPHPDARHYGSLAYHTYFSIFDRLSLKPGDVVADIGCGKGRVVCIAATYPIKEAIGVEIDGALCALGEENGARMRQPHAPVRFACQSASEFDFEPVNKIVMISPFGEKTMEKTLDRVEESLEARPRSLEIAYGNPVLSPLLAAKPWLKLFECWRPGKWSRMKFPVHFYRHMTALMAAALKRMTEAMETIQETMQFCPI